MINSNSAVEKLTRCFPTPEDIPAAFRVKTVPEERFYLIDGQLRSWEGKLADVSSPNCLRQADGTLQRPVIGKVPVMDEDTAMSALNAAVRAWDHGRGTWPTMSVAARVAAMETFAAEMAKVREEVINLLLWEVGKSFDDSSKEFDRTLQYIHKTIDAVKEMDRTNSRFSLDGGVIAQVRRAPLGVCLSMGPFNYPLNEMYTTLIPALIMGNTAVVKPPKFGVLLHQPLLHAFAKSFPPGVVNFIYGRGANITPPLMKSGNVDVLALIGSSRAADTLKREHPRPHRLRSILGLDAKNPALVMADADLDVAVRELVTGALSFNGQRCTALKLTFVHASIVDAFLERLSEAITALPIGLPWDAGVKLTPMPEFNKVEAMQAFVDDAVNQGACVVNPGGGSACETLYFPAVVYPVRPGMKLYTEEQFGPVVPICPYQEEQEFLDYVTQSNYGQQVSLFGRDPNKFVKLIDPLANQVCRINLNAQCQRGPDTLPFTGRKDSAEATLSVSDALRCFSIRSLVAAESNPESREIIQEIVTRRDSNFLRTDFIF